MDFDVPFDSTNSIKTLGIKWFPTEDYFSFRNLEAEDTEVTRRTILSSIAKLFDPLGWISPCVITAKIFMQRLWNATSDWDDPLSDVLREEWERFRREMPLIERVKIPRWIHTTSAMKEIELHGFCDSSEKAYGGVVYLRCLDAEGNIHVNLIISKTKVAPNNRKLTLPRLELCGAVVLAKLLNYTVDTLDYPNVKVYAWTDSMIALGWINATPSRWTTFVANRVSEIQRLLKATTWSHVPTNENPADFPSRGVLPSAMETLEMWWNGPQFLRTSWRFEYPNQPQQIDYQEEQRTVKDHVLGNLKTQSFVKTHVSVVNKTNLPMVTETILKCPSLLKACRHLGYCKRFIKNCRTKKCDRKSGYLHADELPNALIFAAKAVQGEMFGSDPISLKKNARLHGLKTLNAFVDEKGLLRVGGRLQNANLTYDEQHPIILNYNHHFVDLIIRDAHKQTLHGGIQQMMGFIRTRFWICKLRQRVKYWLHKCIVCFRQRAATLKQLMGSLPTARVQMARPFSHTGVDYAGPIDVKSWKGRGGKLFKAYFALFVCLATKAIHLELVSDLTTQAFIAAYRRFTARRGLCSKVYSDCGTNFVGASSELKRMLKAAKHDWKKVAEMAANEGTHWHFIPPASPNFGGLWEAGVKSVKYHLKRVVGTERLTFEELTTLLTQIEACLNSRPLCPLTDNVDELDALTPSHFLIGERLKTVPQADTTSQKIGYLDRWKRVQVLVDAFWNRWNTEYLSRLQQRPKWLDTEKEPNIGDLVLIKDERQPPTFWNLARITEKHPGQDGLTRVVTLKTKSGQLKRPISKICLLPLNDCTENTTII